MKWVLLVFAAFLSFACIPSLEGGRQEGIAQRKALPAAAVGTAPSSKCDDLNSKHAGQVAFATGFGVLALGGAVPTVLLNDESSKESRNLRLSIEIGAGIFSALAAGMTVESALTAAEWSREGCGAQ
jgi:Na+/pantothenate symporter